MYMLNKTIQNKSAIEKSRIKSQEIGKLNLRGEYSNFQYGLRIEIIGNVKVIEVGGLHGIELFAKAWKNGKQMGFGKDGSVEIERFRIFNPPILVDDPNGTIIREWIDDMTKEKRQRKLRESPQEALIQVIEHNLSVIKNIHDGKRIIRGKIGNTTSTFFPESGNAGTAVDGRVWQEVITGDTIANMSVGSGTNVSALIATGVVDWRTDDGTSLFDVLIREIQSFDTSPIGTDEITSATASIFGNNKDDPSANAPAINLFSATPGNPGTLVAGDFDSVGSVEFSTKIFYANFNIAGYNDFALNASGRAQINKTGISSFGYRETEYDLTASEPTRNGGGVDTYILFYSADEAGTAQDPKLVVVHSAVTTFIPKIMMS